MFFRFFFFKLIFLSFSLVYAEDQSKQQHKVDSKLEKSESLPSEAAPQVTLETPQTLDAQAQGALHQATVEETKKEEEPEPLDVWIPREEIPEPSPDKIETTSEIDEPMNEEEPVYTQTKTSSIEKSGLYKDSVVKTLSKKQRKRLEKLEKGIRTIKKVEKRQIVQPQFIFCSIDALGYGLKSEVIRNLKGDAVKKLPALKKQILSSIIAKKCDLIVLHQIAARSPSFALQILGDVQKYFKKRKVKDEFGAVTSFIPNQQRYPVILFRKNKFSQFSQRTYQEQTLPQTGKYPLTKVDHYPFEATFLYKMSDQDPRNSGTIIRILAGTLVTGILGKESEPARIQLAERYFQAARSPTPLPEFYRTFPMIELFSVERAAGFNSFEEQLLTGRRSWGDFTKKCSLKEKSEETEGEEETNENNEEILKEKDNKDEIEYIVSCSHSPSRPMIFANVLNYFPQPKRKIIYKKVDSSKKPFWRSSKSEIAEFKTMRKKRKNISHAVYIRAEKVSSIFKQSGKSTVTAKEFSVNKDKLVKALISVPLY